MPLPLRHPGALVAILLLLPKLAAAAERCAMPAGHIAAVEDLVEVAAGADWTRLALGEPLCVGDTLRAGENGRSAVILNSGAVLRLAPGTTLRIEQAQPGERTLLQLVTGIASFFSRRPHALEIDTPFADAAVEGTEFTLEVEPDRSRVTVLEGRVRFANPLGTVRVAPGEAAVALAGRAPELELRIRPRDAVQWALYYPPLPETRLPAAAPAPLREAARLAAQGRRAEALARLDQLPPSARDTTALTLRAELLLAQGRPAEAETALAEALTRDPRNADALALRAVIAVARNLKDQALADAREAVTLDPTNPRARLALSYAAQAAFDIPQARESLEAAAASTPDDALIQARLAEVRLMQGDIRAARRSATRALELDPANPRAQTVAGFVALARIDTRTAHATFTRAIELDPFNPLAHLGQGLATIRDGDLEAGRAENRAGGGARPGQRAAAELSRESVLEERRDTIAGDELATAKALDPNDPTPWFYEAVRKQLGNRPVEALQELERSMALNQGRALYRSRMLLDEDAAGCSVSAGRIYNDLGFRQLGINEAVRSLALDPANAASHRFLANLYRGEPRLETVRLSEQLQARLLQPVGRNPVQPSLSFADLGSLQQGGPARASFNEFTSLFERDGLQGDATLLAGSDYTRADEAALTGLFGRTAFSVGQLYFDTEGTRPNDELTHEIYTAFAQVALTDALDVQIGFRSRDSDKGDRARQVPDEFDENLTAERDDKVLNLGAKLRVAPTHTFLVSATFADRDASDISDSGSGPSEERVEIRERQQGVQAELQYIQDLDRSALVAGASAYNTPQGEDNSILLTDVFGPEPNEYTVDLDQHGAFAYTYFTSTPLHNLTLTTGIALDTYDRPKSKRHPPGTKIWAYLLANFLAAAAGRCIRSLEARASDRRDARAVAARRIQPGYGRVWWLAHPRRRRGS